MPILDFKINNIGEAGQVPSFIYINTSDDVATVTTPGYLNHIVAQGNAISQTEMALVVTRSPAPTTGLYTIDFSGGDWSLVATGVTPPGGAWLVGGNVLGGTSTFGSINDETITFVANSVAYLIFNTAADRLDIIPDNVQMNCSGSGSFTANTLDFEAQVSMDIGAIATVGIVIGNNDLGTNSTTLASPVIRLQNIPSATKADVVYFDSATQELSFGAAGGGGAAWLLDGSNTGTGHTLGLADTNDFSIVSNSVDRIQFHGTNQDIVLMGGVPASPGPIPAGSVVALAQGFFAATGEGGVNIGATTGDVTVGADAGNANFSAAGGTVTVDGENGVTVSSSTGPIAVTAGTGNIDVTAAAGHLTLEATNGDFNIVNVAPAATAQVLYYNNVGGRVTYGATPAGGGFTSINIQVFQTPGAGTYTPTAGMSYCLVEVIGAGGSGSSPVAPSAGNSGGAGGYARREFNAAAIGAGLGFVIGTGGAAVTTNDNGNPGTATTFGAFITCDGGDAGVGSGGGGAGGGMATGGTYNQFGGQASGGIEVTTPGGPSYIAGPGGASFFSTTFCVNSAVNFGGVAGSQGGGGVGAINVTSEVPSGAGGNGLIIITEFIV